MSGGEINDNSWIIVPNWHRFQHYKDRQPPWIKIYTKLLQDPAYMGLSMAARGVLMGVWLAYSQTNEELLIRDWRAIDRRLGGHWAQLQSLAERGFIEISASSPLAPSTEKEKETPLPPYWKEIKDTGRVTCLHCQVSLPTLRRLEEHLYLQHGAEAPLHWIEAERRTEA